MNYDNIFNYEGEAESFVEKRLEEDRTYKMAKDAGFSQTWDSFVGRVLDDGWRDAVRAASVLEKQASQNNEYEMGKKAAAEFIQNIDRDVPEVRGWFKFMKCAHEVAGSNQKIDKLCELTKEGELDVDFGEREYDGFQIAAIHVEDSSKDIPKLAQKGLKKLKTSLGNQMKKPTIDNNPGNDKIGKESETPPKPQKQEMTSNSNKKPDVDEKPGKRGLSGRLKGFLGKND